MIHYRLRCSAAHEFEGWFPGSDAFDAQAAAGLVVCPHCDDTAVTRALMAPGIATGKTDMAPVRHAAGAVPDTVRTQLRRLRAEIEASCDDVGEEFAAEARRIHAGEAPARGIYGQTTPAQAEALRDDGIEIAAIPWVPLADS
jgi:hypothetical protein